MRGGRDVFSEMAGIGEIKAVLLLFGIVLVAVLTASGCARREAPIAHANSDGRLRIAISIAPLRSLIEPMVPAESEIFILRPISSSPHSSELPPSSIAAAIAADVFITLGGEADPTSRRLVDARTRINKPSIVLADIASNSSAPPQSLHPHTHDHEASEEHLWLAPWIIEHTVPRFRAEVERILEARGALNDTMRRKIHAAAANVLRDVHEVDSAYRTMLEALTKVQPAWGPIAMHGAFENLLAHYGVASAAILEPAHGVEPTPAVIGEAARNLFGNPGVSLIVDSPSPSGAVLRLTERFNIRLIHLDPAGDENWERLMRSNLAAILAGAL